MSYRGFVLQPTYRIHRRGPVVYLWGRLESGESFLVRDDRQRPHFYIRAADCDRATEAGMTGWQEDSRRTLVGEPVARLELRFPSDTPALRDRLHRLGIQTYEADVRFAMRYLIDRDIRGAVEIEGTPRKQCRAADLEFDNPVVRPADCDFAPRVLALDIETDPTADTILSVALHGCGASEVVVVAPGRTGVPASARAVAGEGALLEILVSRVKELDPDILTGWNVIDFDFAVLTRRADDLGIRLSLGRGGGPARFRSSQGWRQGSRVTIPGRLVLDGLRLLRGAFVRLERHSLDYVARQILGEGKTINGSQQASEILRNYRDDLVRFVEYNLTDARLVIDILDELQLVPLVIERSRLTGLPPDRVASSVAAFDFLYLKELFKRELVAPSVRQRATIGTAMGGGHVLEPQPGLYDNVVVLDFKSLYPSLIRSFQIDPLGYVDRPEPGADLIVAPNGAAFRRSPGILPRLLDDLMPRRELAKQRGNVVESQAIKILMNSFYGVLGTPVCRFFNPAVANAITSSGRHLLIWAQRKIEDWGYRVLYGDTDSLFVDSTASDPDSAAALGSTLVARLNRGLEDYLKARWGVESRLEVEFEKLFLRLFLPPVRHGTSGARKRYAGLVERGSERVVEFTGLEAVRRDWTDLARQAQRELYRRLFLNQAVEDYLRHLAVAVRAGELDELLIYRKALRKELDSYSTSSPPHVVAARKQSAITGSLVSYYITVNGPEPVEQHRSRIDYEHYLDRQLQPVAQPVLDLLGLQFGRVIGSDKQLDLFE